MMRQLLYGIIGVAALFLEIVSCHFFSSYQVQIFFVALLLMHDNTCPIHPIVVAALCLLYDSSRVAILGSSLLTCSIILYITTVLYNANLLQRSFAQFNVVFCIVIAFILANQSITLGLASIVDQPIIPMLINASISTLLWYICASIMRIVALY